MDKPIFCSRDLFYKTPFGATALGNTVQLTLCVPKKFVSAAPRVFMSYDCKEPVEYIMQPTGKKMGCDLFSVAVTPTKAGIYFYWFDLYVDYQKVFRGSGGIGYITQDDGERFELFVYKPDYTVPEWMPGSVMYQIFPDRFNDGVKDKVMPFSDRVYRDNKKGTPYFWANEIPEGHLNQDYFGGDFLGIEQKLSYLKQLGVDCIYLNPIFEAHSNHRYNTADYMKADPLLGTNEDFSELCAKAKDKGIKIILDCAFSHTGDDSVYFDKQARYGQNGAYNSIDSPYRSWYHFSKEYPFGYRCWWGFATLPEVDEFDPSYRNFITGKNGVVDYWLSVGASGFRLDVADELPDEFIEDIRTAVKNRGEDKYLVGEVWEDAATKISYEGRRRYLWGDCLDSVMNYPFREAIVRFIKFGDAQSGAEKIMRIAENYPPPALAVAMNSLSTHDTVRILTELGGDDIGTHDRYWQDGRVIGGDRLIYGKKLLRLAFAILFTLPGIPCIYYGDEVFMQGYKDPFNRAFYNWDEPDNSQREEIKKLSKFRKQHSVFKFGEIEIIKAKENLLCYRRFDKTSSVLILINRSSSLKTVVFNGEKYEVQPYDYSMF